MVARDVPREPDEHVVERRRDAHRQRGVDDVVRDEVRKALVASVVDRQSARHTRLVVHLQHVQRYALAELRLEPLRPQTRRKSRSYICPLRYRKSEGMIDHLQFSSYHTVQRL